MPDIHSTGKTSTSHIHQRPLNLEEGSSSGTKMPPPHQTSQLEGPEGLHQRRPTLEMSPIRTPDSQTRLLSARSSPGSPLSAHILAGNLHHLVKASMGTEAVSYTHLTLPTKRIV